MICPKCGALVVKSSIKCYNCENEITEVILNPTLKVLVVEDDDNILDIILQWLRLAGLEPEGAHNGMRAMERFRDNRYDLALVDLDLPFIDGLTLCRNFKDNRPEMPVIICTGYADSLSHDTVVASGADSVVTKPIVLENLLRQIQRLTFGGNDE
jgi:DNA-binding response OmpR family regulator